MTQPFTNLGKQVLANGFHYADGADVTAAEVIVEALNGRAVKAPAILANVEAGEREADDALVRISGDDADEFSFYSDSDEAVITQHRYYRWGDTVIAIGEINYPNQWDDELFDAKCAALETALSTPATPDNTASDGEALRWKSALQRIAAFGPLDETADWGNKDERRGFNEAGRKAAEIARSAPSQEKA